MVINSTRLFAYVLYTLIRNSKGNIVYFTKGRIARVLKYHGISFFKRKLSPKLHGLIESLVDHGLVRICSKSARGIIYCVDKDSMLWSFIKNCKDENKCIEEIEKMIKNVLSK